MVWLSAKRFRRGCPARGIVVDSGCKKIGKDCGKDERTTCGAGGSLAAWLAAAQRVLTLLALSAAAGAVAGVLTAVFGHGVLAATELRERWPWLLVLLPAGGALIVAVYARWGGECGRGMALVFDAAAGRRPKVPARLVPLAVGATWVGHLLGASVGREGVAVQIAAAGAGLLTPGLRAPQDRRRLVIAGVAAGFAGLFRTPLAAAFFALELFHTGVAQYDVLLPAVTAALTASAVSGALGVSPATAALGAEAPALTVETLIALAVLGAACGLAGRLFVGLLHGLKDRFGRWMPNAYQRIVLVGALVALFGLATGSRYNGLSEGLSAAALAGGSLYLWDWLAKLCLTAVCLAAGFQGGEVAPLFTIGAAYAAVFAAGTNTLVSPILVGLELFGGEYFAAFFLVCAMAYACNGGHSIYPQTRLSGEN